MKDIQNQHDFRNIPVDKVGIKNLRYPITVLDRKNGFQHTIASINMYVDLPERYKGTHMSRFVELLHLFRPEVSLKKISDILEQMKEHLNAASAHIEITFPYFIEKKAPISNSPGLVGDFSLNKTRGENNYIVGDKYQRLFKEIKTIQNGFALYLPFDYSMQIKNYWADSLVELKLGGNMTGADSANEAVSTLYRNICAGNSATPLSKILNIQYIVLDKNPNSYQKHASAGCAVESYYGTPYIWGTYDFFNGLFASNKIYYEDNNFKIYELNNLIRPEISTLDNLYSFDLSNNADTKYNFINKQLGGQFYFITSTAKNDIDPLTQIFIPFENIGLENVSINSTLVAITNIDAQKK
ncbi:MAG: GTP cyclohydrolase I FolE2, partial [Actinobacteria bacterium]|nr:GTP cyclohydrolase I FolE2 [Actinomycetota bacterium]